MQHDDTYQSSSFDLEPLAAMFLAPCFCIYGTPNEDGSERLELLAKRAQSLRIGQVARGMALTPRAVLPAGLDDERVILCFQGKRSKIRALAALLSRRRIKQHEVDPLLLLARPRKYPPIGRD